MVRCQLPHRLSDKYQKQGRTLQQPTPGFRPCANIPIQSTALLMSISVGEHYSLTLRTIGGEASRTLAALSGTFPHPPWFQLALFKSTYFPDHGQMNDHHQCSLLRCGICKSYYFERNIDLRLFICACAGAYTPYLPSEMKYCSRSTHGSQRVFAG